MELRAFGTWTFASFKDPDDKSGKTRYLFLRVRKDPFVLIKLAK